MANLSVLGTESRQRGQVILVTGFALAISFVALALVMNSVIYTENLATRSESAKASDAVKVADDMADGTESLINYANNHNNSTYGNLQDNVTTAIDDIDRINGDQQAVAGQAVSLSLVESNNGTLIKQTNNSRTFENDNAVPGTDWVPLTNIGEINRATLGITKMAEVNASLTNFVTYTFNASDGADTWELTLRNYSTAYAQDRDKFEIEVEGTTLGNYSAGTIIDLKNGSINGSAEPDLELGEGIGPIEEIEFEDGDNVEEGNYTIFVQNDSNALDTPADYNTSGGSPSFERYLYNATIRVQYEERRMEYATDIDIVPEVTDRD